MLIRGASLGKFLIPFYHDRSLTVTMQSTGGKIPLSSERSTAMVSTLSLPGPNTLLYLCKGILFYVYITGTLFVALFAGSILTYHLQLCLLPISASCLAMYVLIRMMFLY
jgi:hypothetical protein